MMNKKITAAITAVGGYVPPDKLTNFDLEKMVDTNDEWIRTRTGITERRILKGEGLATSDMVVPAVKELLKDKITLLSGHSGVGKSTFINYIFPHLSLKTQDVSGWSGKGLHTTTFAEMFDLPFGGKIIDTPGIREMGLVDI